jgi:hypothetical protein
MVAVRHLVGDNEMRRESDRQRRFHRMKAVVEMVLREIDECGIMRKPSWDGVRALLLILPLTEGGLRILIFFSRSDSEILIGCRDIQFPREAVDVRGGVEPGILALLVLWSGVRRAAVGRLGREWRNRHHRWPPLRLDHPRANLLV